MKRVYTDQLPFKVIFKIFFRIFFRRFFGQKKVLDIVLEYCYTSAVHNKVRLWLYD